MFPVPTARCCSTKSCRTSRPFLRLTKLLLKFNMLHFADVLVPPNDEGTRATVLRWCKAVGDTVAKDEPLVELETDKVTVEIPAPADGTLVEVLKQVNAEVNPDEVLARLSLSGDSTAPQATATSTATAPSAGAPAVPDARDARRPLSPAVRRLLKELSIAAGDIEGTGRDGRITAQDVTRHAADAAANRAPVSAAGSTRVLHTAIRRR